MIIIDGESLSIKELIKVARDGEKIKLKAQSSEKIKKSRKIVEEFVENNSIVYGVTTGFGKFSDTRISPREVIHLQENLIKSHSAGTGDNLSLEIVRAMILLRINALAKGYSGIRLKTINLLVDMLNNNIVPLVPEHGSVGASGDLVPLAHMVLVMLGKGFANVDGDILSGDKALNVKGLSPIKLKSKEGLALINGTQMMSAHGAIAINDSLNLFFHVNYALALSLEALKGILSAFDENVHKLRPHPGQIKTARHIRTLVKGSKLALYERADRVQDAYTLRCAPQVHGASYDAITHVQDILIREINSVTDNPLIFPESKEVISGGNFHGQPLALGMDYLAMAVSELGNISERRIARLIDSSLNNGLEMFLTKYGGLNSGYMIAQYTAASLVAENKVLANPASIDSIPTSANQEDHVSMGSVSGRKLLKIINNVEQIIAIEMLLATQAIDLRTDDPYEKLGIGSKKIYSEIRKIVEPLEEDRILYPELYKVKELIHKGDLKEKIE